MAGKRIEERSMTDVVNGQIKRLFWNNPEE